MSPNALIYKQPSVCLEAAVRIDSCVKSYFCLKSLGISLYVRHCKRTVSTVVVSKSTVWISGKSFYRGN